MQRPSGLRRTLAVAGAAITCVASAQEEVPFITTPDTVTLAMLQLAGVGPTDRVVDLGSGDGRIVITAARRFGARGLGVEIVPELVLQSRRHAQTAGVADHAEFRVQDLFATDLRGFSVVTMYLLPEVNLQLRPRLLALPAGTRVVSHDWDMGEWAPDRTLTLDVPNKAIGREKKSSVHMWVVPAAVQGLWCTVGAQLDVTQRFQAFSATLQTHGVAAPVMVFDGRIQGTALKATGPVGEPRAELYLQGDTLHLQRAAAPAVGYEGRRFTRAGHSGCVGG